MILSEFSESNTKIIEHFLVLCIAQNCLIFVLYICTSQIILMKCKISIYSNNFWGSYCQKKNKNKNNDLIYIAKRL